MTLGHGTRLGAASEVDQLYSQPNNFEEAAAGEDIARIRPGPLNIKQRREDLSPAPSLWHLWERMK